MKKKFVGIGAIVAAIAAIPYLVVKHHKKRKMNRVATKIDAIMEAPPKDTKTDFKDENHLIFCDESNLGRRLVQLDKSINIRDIGGYTGLNGRKLKWGKVYRSEELCHLTDDDVDYFENINLKYVYDFRDAHKAERMPDKIPSSAVYENIAILDGAPINFSDIDFSKPGAVDLFMSKLYRYIAEDGVKSYAKVLKDMTDPNSYPLLFHCTNGKDRTGILAALILMICGVPRDVVISDYTLTNLTFDEAFEVLGSIMAEEVGEIPGMTKDMFRDFFGVKTAWLQILFDYIDANYAGDVNAYLLAKTDLTAEDLNGIRENLLMSPTND